MPAHTRPLFNLRSSTKLNQILLSFSRNVEPSVHRENVSKLSQSSQLRHFHSPCCFIRLCYPFIQDLFLYSFTIRPPPSAAHVPHSLHRLVTETERRHCIRPFLFLPLISRREIKGLLQVTTKPVDSAVSFSLLFFFLFIFK